VNDLDEIVPHTCADLQALTSIGQWWQQPQEKNSSQGAAHHTIPSLSMCRKLHLFLEKSTKTAATRAALFDSNMHQIFAPDPLGTYF